MELTPLSSNIDRRLKDIDRQINSALADIRRNLEELERASPGSRAEEARGRAGDKDFAATLRKAMERGGAS